MMVDLMLRIFSPREWYNCVFGLVFFNLAVIFVGAAIKYALRGELGEPWFNHIVLATTISTPFAILVQMLMARLLEVQEELLTLASTDTLTGLANRRAFFERMEDPRQGVAMMLDIDHFKRINDTYGHDVGDMVLQRVAELLKDRIRGEDIVARLGGEEFAVYLNHAPLHKARQIGERLCEGVVFDVGKGNPGITVTMSAGAVASDGKRPLAELLRIADGALYQAKKAGRARLVFSRIPSLAKARAMSLGMSQA